MGINAIIKRTHLCTGIILIARYVKKTHTNRLASLPMYIKINGDKLSNFPSVMVNAGIIYGTGEYVITAILEISSKTLFWLLNPIFNSGIRFILSSLSFMNETLGIFQKQLIAHFQECKLLTYYQPFLEAHVLHLRIMPCKMFIFVRDLE